MRNTKEFPFNKSRRVTAKETSAARKAIEKITGKKRGRPTKTKRNKYVPISIRLHPKVIDKAKKEARAKGVGYQSIINEVLMKKFG